MRRRLIGGTLSVLMVVAMSTVESAAAADLRIVEITYSVAARGAVTSVESFAAGVDEVFKDPRGWSLGGAIRFRRVSTGGNFRLLVVANAIVPTYGGFCTLYFSCQPGRDIVINDDRWRGGSKYWPGSVRMYRHLVINHEVGHWLGFRHTSCPSAGALAPVAMQQSKGLGGCVANPWPTPQERQRLASVRGVSVLPLPSSRTVSTPSGLGSWRVAPDGGVFTFGDAGFFGSAGDIDLRAPVTAMASTPTGRGYWLVAVDGGVFTFGDAAFKGSAADLGIVAADIRMTASGYEIVTRTGAVIGF